jgi:asparagine synthetase B (glutamine-hydrolysing)
VRRRPGLQTAFEQTLPSWLSPPVANDERLRARARPEPARRLFEAITAHESRWYLSAPYLPRALTWVNGAVADHGVEVRSPLLDERVVRLAASRPVEERSGLRESKALLRAAMIGVLPDSVLAPRATKTGVPTAYFRRQMKARLRPTYESLLARRPGLRLSDLKLVEIDRLRAALATYESSGEHQLGVQLYLTLQAEAWLRTIP